MRINRYVTLDKDLWEQARAKRLNISRCCDKGIAMELKMPVSDFVKPQKKNNIERAKENLNPRDLASLKAVIGRDESYAVNWRKIIRKKTNILLSLNEVIELARSL